MKQETIEEIAKRIYPDYDTEYLFNIPLTHREGFIKGYNIANENKDDFAIEFHQWMRVNDTKENAEKYFHYTDKDMLNEFKKGL